MASRIVTAFIAIAGISMAFLGIAKRRLNLLERMLMLGGSIALIPEFWVANLCGLAGFAVALTRQGFLGRRGVLNGAKDRSAG